MAASYIEWRASLDVFSKYAREVDDLGDIETKDEIEGDDTEEQKDEDRILKLLECKKDIKVLDASVTRTQLPMSIRISVTVPTILPLGARCALVGSLLNAGKEVSFLTSSAAVLAVAHCDSLADILAKGYGEARLLVVELAEGTFVINPLKDGVTPLILHCNQTTCAHRA